MTEYSEDDSPDVALIDYLERSFTGNDEYRRYPRIPDQCETEMKQIMGIESRYEWEIHTRIQKLKLRNHSMISDYSNRVILE